MLRKLLNNSHAGEILKTEFIDEIGISQNHLADLIGVPANRIHEIFNGKRGITANTDLRLCKYFGLSEGYFLRLQNAYDIMEEKPKIQKTIIDKIIPYHNKVGLKEQHA
jgi:antitoxin HigA-1